MSAESVQAQTRRRLEGRRTIRRRVQRYRPCMSQNDQAKSDHVAPKFYRRVRSSFHMSLEFDSRLASSHSQLGLHGKYVCTQVSSLSVLVLIEPRKHACATRGRPCPFPGIQNDETLSHSQRAVADVADRELQRLHFNVRHLDFLCFCESTERCHRMLYEVCRTSMLHPRTIA